MPLLGKRECCKHAGVWCSESVLNPDRAQPMVAEMHLSSSGASSVLNIGGRGWQGHVCGGSRDDEAGERDDEVEDSRGGCRNCGERHSSPGEVAQFLRGKKLAIDLSCWVVQCDTAVIQPSQEVVTSGLGNWGIGFWGGLG